MPAWVSLTFFQHSLAKSAIYIYLAMLYKTMILTEYYGLFRIGEITQNQHNIKAHDVLAADDKKKVQIYLRSSKTNQLGQTSQIVEIQSQ